MRMYEYHELRTEMYSKGYTVAEMAVICDMNEVSFRRKLDGISPWTLDNIYDIANALDIDSAHIMNYFPNRRKNA